MEFETSPKKFKQVLMMASKPGWDEFKKVAGITLAVLTSIGFVGFIIYLIMIPVPG